MRNLFWVLGLAAGMCCAGVSSAQAQERCGTTQLRAQVAQSAERQAFEAQSRLAYQQYVQSAKISGGERVIPTVVHLIEQLPVPAISDARVQSQIDVLNEDFRKLNADTALIPLEFQSVAANCQIRFCLATIDPNGCPTNGINHVFAPQLAIHGIDDEQALKSYVQWDPHRYLNVWVPVNLKDNLLGYATLPDWLNFAPQNDGVVINGNNFGRGNGTPASSYALGRTATHEIGHWLGLYHTFDGGCAGMSPQNCMSQGDEVCDTPPTSGPMYGCPGGPHNSCQESPTDHNDQTMNYMDYTDDACMFMFSAGQRDRMFFYLDNARAQLWSPANLAATGCDGTVSAGCAPVANFSAAPANICAGETVAFHDLTSGLATAWNWTFAGGNPATSTLQNPTVTFSQPGTYAVTLIASNSVGIDTLVRSTFVTVAAPRVGPIVEGFEGLSSLPLDWYALDGDQGGSWQISTVAGRSGQQSVFVPDFAAPVPHTIDDLVSHVIDLTGVVPGELTFAHAYRRRDSFNQDSLQVWATTDCGVTWQKLWEKYGNMLLSIGGYAGVAPFVPTATQWKNDTVDLSALAGAAQMRLRFRMVGGASQDLYLDEINLSLATNATDGNVWAQRMQVFPNPSSAAPTVQIQLGRTQSLQLQLTDLQGHVLLEMGAMTFGAGAHAVKLEEDAWGKLPAGLYFLTAAGGAKTSAVKVVKLQ